METRAEISGAVFSLCLCVCAEPETECYSSRGTGYRGVVGTTVSGARCLPWNSDLLFDELHVGTVAASPLRGLGEHAFCRCVPKGFPVASTTTLSKYSTSSGGLR